MHRGCEAVFMELLSNKSRAEQNKYHYYVPLTRSE